MPVAPTYPGVYIEEIPSGVQTITGVSTSITAFIGYTARGPVDDPVHIFSFADFERAFGGLAFDSPLSHAVKQFFQNGGSDAYVVRTALGAAVASVTLRSSTSAPVLVVSALTAGTWGNALQVDVDYDTANPRSVFNMRVTEFFDQNGTMVPGRTEVFRNLTHNPTDSNYVVANVAANSQLIAVTVPVLAAAGKGTSESGGLSMAEIAQLNASANRLGLIVDGGPPIEIILSTPVAGPLAAALAAIAADIVVKAGAQGVVVAAAAGAATITITGNVAGIGSSVRVINAGSNNAAKILKFGLVNGGTEIDAAAAFRPQQTGTAGTPTALPVTATGSIQIDVKRGAAATILKSIPVPIWGPGVAPVPTTFDELVTALNAALLTASAAMLALVPPEPFLSGATAQHIGPMIRVLPGTGDPNLSFDVVNNGADTTATVLGLAAAGARNVARYAPGSGLTALQQVSGTAGNNGTPPGSSQLTGTEAAKTGIYALEKVDLFNLLVIPEATVGAGLTSVLTEAIAYCTRRRAFLIMDAPENVKTFAQAQAWIGAGAAPFRSRNVAIYFPRIQAPNPLMNNIITSFPVAGAMAGLYARTDADRGVWKAPAGTSANIVGATGLTITLTDKENGVLNPNGLNCLRNFPIYGTVSWGARTARGADAMSDEYKYIPVRRLALFLEESLYRGTQWAVFEPNDEPLWAQVRLNLGGFMHVLYSQGAFQGRTPRDAYFVKCDKETTTQNDIDLGRVNIVVGFAPLKPAEFVIIHIQQIAGAILT